MIQPANKIKKLAETKFLLVVSCIVLVVSVLLSNLLFSLVQNLATAIKEANNQNAQWMQSFHMSWNDIFNFHTDVPHIIYFYLATLCITLFGLARFWYNMKINYSALNTGQHGTSEFEDVQELRKQYKVVPGSKKNYPGGSGVIVSALQKGNRYELFLDTGPVHTAVIGISRSGKGERYVFPSIDVISRAEEKDSLIVNDPKGGATRS